MADLSIEFCGIKSPNPFWLASAPPTYTAEQVMRAFDAGWGGAVWKTITTPSPVISSRFGCMSCRGRKMISMNNAELLSDRPIAVNFAEIEEVKKSYPHNVVIASLMGANEKEWEDLLKRSEDAGVDGVELNLSCPCVKEKNLGLAIGQNNAEIKHTVSLVKSLTKLPVLTKLTPNIADICSPALAAQEAGSDALALINTINAVMGVDLELLTGNPHVREKFTNGGMSGPAVKPIALSMITKLTHDPRVTLPISGIGGIETWEDVAEFIALGASTVQVCTAVMHYGYGIVENMATGLSEYLDRKKISSLSQLVGRAAEHFSTWSELDQNYAVVAQIDGDKCIGCQQCYVACRDGAHQCIHTTKEPCKAYHGKHDHAQSIRLKQPPISHEKNPKYEKNVPFIDERECVGCNLCSMLCPADAIKMVEKAPGSRGQAAG